MGLGSILKKAANPVGYILGKDGKKKKRRGSGPLPLSSTRLQSRERKRAIKQGTEIDELKGVKLDDVLAAEALNNYRHDNVLGLWSSRLGNKPSTEVRNKPRPRDKLTQKVRSKPKSSKPKSSTPLDAWRSRLDPSYKGVIF